MKLKTVIKSCAFILAAFLNAGTGYAGAGHDHSTHDHGATEHAAHESAGGPNGGRLITIVEPHLEFWVTPERFVQITFVGHDGKMVPVGDQVVSAIGGNRSAPTKVEFVKDGDRLISTAALPEIKNMPIILQITATPDAKRVRETFYLNMSDCGGCDYKEYACICGH